MHSASNIEVPHKADSQWTSQRRNQATSASAVPSETGKGLWALRRRYTPRPELATCVRQDAVSNLSRRCSDSGVVYGQHAMPSGVANAEPSATTEEVLLSDIRRLLLELEKTVPSNGRGAEKNATIQNVKRLVEVVRRRGTCVETTEAMPLLFSIRSCLDDLLLPRQVPLLSTSSSGQRAASEQHLQNDNIWEGYEDIASEDFLQWLVDFWSGHEQFSYALCNPQHFSTSAELEVTGNQPQALLTERAIAQSVSANLSRKLRRSSFANGPESVSTRSPTSSIDIQSVCASHKLRRSSFESGFESVSTMSRTSSVDVQSIYTG